ncbi:EAL domain-containing protein [Oscillibacter sp. MSJ-2]|uniref:EAL domain-containing protein n=1 Tax=Dysosmobacter acutus TaxID=2841504 RepID=A0ABS6F529_9FIRM|nr:EAL domain-containing protein [Dysosmobacter acutus]MBU5625403.1 EAL domain-containing protein [Dysosmobacter acutus]
MERKKLLLLGQTEKLRTILFDYELCEGIQRDTTPFSAVVLMLPAAEEELWLLRSGSHDLPVLVVTEHPEEREEVRMLTLGVDDYIRLSPGLVRCRVDKAVRQYEQRGALPESVVRELRHRAEHDALTGIYNQTAFYRTAAQLLQNTSASYVLVRWNIERFKLVNDMYGIQAGNGILCAMAEVLSRELPEGSVYGRLNADHFAACVPEESLCLKELVESLQKQVEVFHVRQAVTVSAGIYRVEDPSLPVDQMCDRANLALQTIKGNYKCHIAWYTEQMWEDMLREQEIRSTMEEALHQRQFQVYLQPVYSLSEGRAVSAEALVRWVRPGGEVVGPDTFIPLFEKNGFIAELDLYVWTEVCRYLQERQRRGLAPLPISVNISRASLYVPETCGRICDVTGRFGIAPSLFRLEITESAYVEEPERIQEAAEELRGKGYLILMDDFGSGYSSLNTLKDLPMDIIKLDTKFLEGFERGGRVGTVLVSILRMARWLNLPVIAEGVETQEQVDFLYSAGCDRIQGYCFARPMCTREFEKQILIPIPERKGNALPGRVNQADVNILLGGNPVVNRLLDGAFGGVAFCEMHDGCLEVLRVNDGFYQIMGCTPKSFAKDSDNLWEVLAEEDREMSREACAETVRTGKPVRQVVRCTNRAGKLLCLDSIYSCLGSDGQRALICVAFNDIAQQLKTERERQEAQQQLIYRDQLSQILLAESDTLSFDYSIQEDAMVFNFLNRKGERATRRIRRYLAFVERSSIIEPEYRHVVRETLERGGRHPMSGTFEFVSDYTGRGYRWYKATYVSIGDREGRVFRIVGKAVDVTEQKSILWQEENGFSHAFETGLVESCLVNLSRGVIESCRSQKRKIDQAVGKAFTCESFAAYCKGLIADESLGRETYERMNPQALSAAYGRGEQTAQVEFPILEKSGELCWMRLEVRLMKNTATGDLIASYHLWDINTRKVSQEIVETVVRLDYDFLARISIKNQTYALYGVKECAGACPADSGGYEAACRKSADTFIHPEDRTFFLEQMMLPHVLHELETEERFTFTYRLMDQDGSVRHKRMTFSHLDPSYLIATRADVTRETEEENRKNTELRQALEEVRKADDVKGRFLSRMSREIRAPMDAILGMAELGRRQPDLSVAAREYLKKIQETGEYMRGLVNDILDVYSIQSGTFRLRLQPVKVRELLEQLQAMIKPTMVGGGLLFTMKVAGLRRETVLADPFRLQQALMNLLTNAAKRTPSGGRVYLSVRQMRGEESPVRLRFRIRNTGAGLEPDSCQPLEQEDGLGLTLVREIVDAMGGTLRTDLQKDRGCCCTVDIAFQEARQPQAASEQLAEPGFDFRGKRALVVEDIPLSAEITGKLLESRGFAVEYAMDGRESVEKVAAATSGYYDAILMDIRMPVMDGLEATRRIRVLRRSDARRLPIVAMTAGAFDSDIRASFEAGMDAHLEKPVQPERLFQTLGALIFSRKTARAAGKKGSAAHIYQMLMTDSRSQVFEYSVDNDIMTYSDIGEDGVHSVRSVPDFCAFVENSGRFRDAQSLLRTISNFEHGTGRHELLFQARLDESGWRWYSARCKCVRDSHGCRVVGKIEDVDEQTRRTIALRERAEFDQVTGLYNRATFQEMVENAVNDSRAEALNAFIEFDLDNFKQVNDTFGHLAGDELLCAVGKAVTSCCRQEDIVGRLGGDEFAIWIGDVGSRENAMAKARQVAEALSRNRQDISASFGVVVAQGKNSFRELFRKADAAMYQAKRNGKNECCLYEERD